MLGPNAAVNGQSVGGQHRTASVYIDRMAEVLN